MHQMDKRGLFAVFTVNKCVIKLAFCVLHDLLYPLSLLNFHKNVLVHNLLEPLDQITETETLVGENQQMGNESNSCSGLLVRGC